MGLASEQWKTALRTVISSNHIIIEPMYRHVHITVSNEDKLRVYFVLLTS
jgi:hypothetical protein